MSKSSRVETYFSSVATTYQTASTRALWRLVRDRERNAVGALLQDVAGRDVLELGCGAGYYTCFLIERGARHVVAVDLSPKMLEQLPKGCVTPLLGDASTVDPGRRFTHLLSAGMLEFVPDPVAALRNAARLAQPGATMVILVPTQSWLGRGYRRFHRRHGLDIQLFGRTSIEQMARATGWRLTEWRTAGPYSAVARLLRDDGR